MFSRLPVSILGAHIRWTVLFLWLICTGFVTLIQLSCASEKKHAEAPGGLFEKAEKDSKAIAARMQEQERDTFGEKTEELEKIEEQNRKEAIEKYRALLKKKDRLDPATYETSLINLGHIVFEQCLANYRKSMQTYDKEYKEFSRGASKEQPVLPKYDFSPAREVYEVFLEAFPNSPLVPEVLYYLAYSYEEEGDLDRAVALFDELALTAPNARFAPEVYMRLGEHHFELSQFDKAIQYYEKVTEKGQTPLYDKALFKIGWSYYAQSRYEESKEAFAKVLDLQSERKKVKQEDLYKESIEILAKILSETGGARALEQFLEQHRNPQYGLDLSMQLGDYFQETSRHKDAIATYRKILQTYPLSPQAPFVEQSLIKCLKTERQIVEAEELQASMLDRYGKSTAWDQANEDQALKDRVDGLLRKNLDALILAHHRAARETKDPKEFAKAIDLYERFLGYFSLDETTYETRFRFAECLFESGHLEEAALEYERVSKTTPFDAYREKAASKRIQCLERLREEGKIDMEALLASYGDYVRMNPDSEKTPPLLFKQGEVLFNNARHNEAAQFFQKVIQEYPTYPGIRRAWMLELESLFQAARYPELERFCRDLMQKGLSLTADQNSRVEHLLRFAQFEQARSDQERGNFTQAAKRYEQIVHEAPEVQIAPDALFNAAICYQEANDWPKAATCFNGIVTRYPKSKYYKDSLLAPLPHYEETHQWDRVLMLLEKLYVLDPQDELSRESLYRIGKRFYKEGRVHEARDTFAQYKRRYPHDTSRKLEISFLEAKISEDRGDEQGALQGYKRFLDAYRAAKTVQPEIEIDPSYVAKARFLIMAPQFEDYRAVQLREPLKKSLERKQALLDRVVSGYMETAKSGAGEYALAAAFRIGEAYQDFWKCLIGSELPSGLSEEEVPVYRDLLKQQAQPYQEKAQEAYETALNRAREKGVLNAWVFKTYGQLAEMDPKHYPSLLQDSAVWQEVWKEKRSLISKIDLAQRRDFSRERAGNLQQELSHILADLQKGIREEELDRGQILQAARLLQQMLAKEPSLYEVHFNLGVLHQMLGDDRRAEQDYRTALKENPRIPLALLNLGIICLQQGRFPKAEECFKDMTLLSPKYAGGWYLLGVCEGKQGAYAEAIPSLKRSISLLPQFLDPYIELAWVQFRAGDVEQAKENFQVVWNHPNVNIRLLRKLAWHYLEAGSLEEAVAAYQRILKTKEATYEDVNNLGAAYLRKGDLDQAQRTLVKAVKMDPGRPEAFNNLGLAFLKRKDLQRSLEHFDQASRIQPGFTTSVLNAAVVYGEYMEDVERSTELIGKYLAMGGTLQRDMLEEWISGS